MTTLFNKEDCGEEFCFNSKVTPEAVIHGAIFPEFSPSHANKFPLANTQALEFPEADQRTKVVQVEEPLSEQSGASKLFVETA